MINYNCPRKNKCNKNRCAKHGDAQINDPVHSPCEWYVNHIVKLERNLERKMKLNQIEKRR
jgi:hypothetical protein